MPFDASYQSAPRHLELGEGFFDPVEPARFPRLRERFRNQAWAERVGLSSLTSSEWEASFARFEPLPGNLPQPLALRYHGDQFRHYNPDLGDGRGFLFAQMLDAKNGRLLDLGTKGSGRTPWSRSGDGRLTLKGAVREALATEMLEALGVYTSKTFSIFETGESLERNDEPSPTRAAVLVRLSHSHIRFGTFQRLAYLGEKEKIARLLAYAAKRYFPGLDPAAPASELAPAFLGEVAERTARLAASWMIAGFVHGVLNTDNMNVTGESFDYGPYRFLPTYDPEFTAAYFDQTSLYAYGRQPECALWNLQRLAQALAPVAGDPKALVAALDRYAPAFNGAIMAKFLERLGLEPQSAERNEALFMAAFQLLEAGSATAEIGFDQFFHDAYAGRALATPPYATLREWAPFAERASAFAPTAAARAALARDPEHFAQAKPCSLLIDEIESIWEAIAAGDDWSRFANKIAAIRRMRTAYGRNDALDSAP